MKINIKYLEQYGVIEFEDLNESQSHRIQPLDIGDISNNNASTLNAWKSDSEFRRIFSFFSTSNPGPKVPPYPAFFQVDTLPLKSSDSFYGNPDRLCRDEEPRCSTSYASDLYCKENVEINNSSFDICVYLGEEDTFPCKKTSTGAGGIEVTLEPSEWWCQGRGQKELYCNRDIDLCIQLKQESPFFHVGRQNAQ